MARILSFKEKHAIETLFASLKEDRTYTSWELQFLYRLHHAALVNPSMYLTEAQLRILNDLWNAHIREPEEAKGIAGNEQYGTRKQVDHLFAALHDLELTVQLQNERICYLESVVDEP